MPKDWKLKVLLALIGLVASGVTGYYSGLAAILGNGCARSKCGRKNSTRRSWTGSTTWATARGTGMTRFAATCPASVARS